MVGDVNGIEGSCVSEHGLGASYVFLCAVNPALDCSVGGSRCGVVGAEKAHRGGVPPHRQEQAAVLPDHGVTSLRSHEQTHLIEVDRHLGSVSPDGADSTSGMMLVEVFEQFG